MSGGGDPYPGGRLLGLTPGPPPPQGFRIIPGRVWWNLIFPQWRLYIAARRAVIPASPPFLGSAGSRDFYFTDQGSLQGHQTPADIASRLSLYAQVQLECQLFGCAIVQFAVPAGTAVPAPSYAGTPAGLTTGGAREWQTTTNLALDDTMQVRYINPPSGSRRHWFDLPL